MLGAFKAQMELKIGAIGGKDSMSGSFEDLDVPPTLVSFAVTTGKLSDVISPEFKGAGHKVVLVKPQYDKNNLPVTESLIDTYNAVTKLIREGKVLSAYTPTYGGVAEGVMKMAFGNSIGFEYDSAVSSNDIFGYNYGAFVLELADDTDFGTLLGHTTEKTAIKQGDKEISLDKLLEIYEGKLEPIFHCNIEQSCDVMETAAYSATSYPAPSVKTAKPKVIIPVFPGTNCEYDAAKVFANAGAEPQIMVINNMTADDISRSVENVANAVKSAQMIFIPGGFSGGDEPDGSGKFITAFFRNEAMKEQVHALLNDRDGLMCGICNGFQALIKLGLVPYGKIIDTDENCPTLTFNTIARHQSRMVRTRVSSNKSPWLKNTNVGDIYNVPISHGEGRFYASEELVKQLIANGQVATQYVDLDGNITSDIRFNPNNSVCAIEGITSPDGRVFGKMGHTERYANGLYKNVDGNYDMKLFTSAVEYFK